MHIYIDAPNQVGGILFVCQPTRHCARGTAIRQNINRTATGCRAHEGVSVNGYEQVCFDTAGFFNAHMQRYEIITVTCEVGPHAGRGVDSCFELLCDRQHDIFFARPAFANRTWVFAAVTRVEGDRNHALAASKFLGWR